LPPLVWCRSSGVDAEFDVDDDRRALISVERNIANIERSMSATGGSMGAEANAGSPTTQKRHWNDNSKSGRGAGLNSGARSSSLMSMASEEELNSGGKGKGRKKSFLNFANVKRPR
jgi:hypothetical protein